MTDETKRIESDAQGDLLAGIQRTTTAMAQQWQHRIQRARCDARDQAAKRGMLSSSIRFSLEGQAIAHVVDSLVPEAEQMLEKHLKGAINSEDLPTNDALTQSLETPIRRLIEREVADLRGLPKRQAFPGSSIHNGAINAAVAGIEPALSLLNARITTILQNRRAELISAERTREAARPKPKQETFWQRAYRNISVVRTIWWPIGVVIGFVVWALNGFPLPF